LLDNSERLERSGHRLDQSYRTCIETGIGWLYVIINSCVLSCHLSFCELNFVDDFLLSLSIHRDCNIF